MKANLRRSGRRDEKSRDIAQEVSEKAQDVAGIGTVGTATYIQ